jgi:hypothetical protein
VARAATAAEVGGRGVGESMEIVEAGRGDGDEWFG